MKHEDSLDSEEEDDDFNEDQSNPESEGSDSETKKPTKKGKGKLVKKDDLIGQKRKRQEEKKRKDAAAKYIDDMASDSDELELRKEGNIKDQYYEPDQLKKTNKPLDLNELERKHRRRAEFEALREE